MFFDWFNTKEVTLLAIKLANDLSAELEKNNKNPKKANEHNARSMQKICRELNQYQQKNKLNFLKKSKLANEFRWRLTEIGHQKDFVDSTTQELLMHMN
ncbi:hypothetical protein [Methylotenera sp. G11]|uniref:hypothetical protein n=1 Tax=Methylotenera sp. G11 TaxID=1506585 RepID=UPI0006479502|nr:hypothetical protein [Methylotenera sp. G11]